MSRNRHSAVSCLALLLVGAGLSGCSKPKPPLVPGDSVAGLKALPSDSPDFHAAMSGTDTVIPIGDALRTRAQSGMQLAARMLWVPGKGPEPSDLFAGYQPPVLLCPPKDEDDGGVICAFLASPRPDMVPTVPRASLAVFVAFGLDAVEHSGSVERDGHAMLEPGEIATREGIAGSVSLDRLGKHDIACRADRPAGGHWERRTCELHFGPYWLHVSRDALLAESTVFSAPSDDPVLMRDVADAGQLLASTLSLSPPLQRALPPVPDADDAAAMFMGMVQQGSAGSMKEITQRAEQATTDTPSKRILETMAKNGVKLVWHDAQSQSDFDLICRHAAEAKQPILLLTGIPSAQIDAVLFGNQNLPFASKAQLVVVRSEANGRLNPWAVAFIKAIGASVDPSITFTDTPKMSGDQCRLGKAYQSTLKDQKAAPVAPPTNN